MLSSAYKHDFQFSEFGDIMDEILRPKYNGSVNVYMFHGGTNFGFMAGANAGGPDPPKYMPDVTSYGALKSISALHQLPRKIVNVFSVQIMTPCYPKPGIMVQSIMRS